MSDLTSPSGIDTDGTVEFTLSFNEPVDAATVTSADFTIGGGTIDSISPTTGTASSFTVTASGTGDAGSTLVLAAKLGAEFADAAGNSITLDPAVTDTAAIDTVHPSVVSFTTDHQAGDHIKAGETVAITATMSEVVQKDGQITVNLSSGGTAVLNADEEGSTLTGTYTVLDGENVDTLSVTGITLNGSAPLDVAGNAMTDPTVPALNLSASAIEVDTVNDAGADFGVTVKPSDELANLIESGDVSLTLQGVDADAVGVEVTVTGTGREPVTADATAPIAGGDGWTVADLDLSEFDSDQTLSVTAVVTDDAGNTATATDTLVLDKAVKPPVILQVASTHTAYDGRRGRHRVQY